MINSLGKDSHTTAHDSFAIKKNSISQKDALTGRSVEQNLSFKGIAAARLANTKQADVLVQSAQKALGENVKFKNVQSMLSEVINLSMDAKAQVSDASKEFSKKNKGIVNSFINMTKKLVKENKPDIKGKDFIDEITKESNVAISTMPSLKKGFYQKAGLHKFLDYANDHQAMFSAFFAAVLTCVLRPATTLALPSEKKNIDDKKYSAAHSISSGLIGIVYPLVFSDPIAKAMNKKIGQDPTKYLDMNNNVIKGYLKTGSNGALTGKNFDIAKRYIGMIPEIGLAIPKASLTIALIPIILKNVFGLEKGKGSKQPPQTVAAQQPVTAERKVA